MWDTLLENLKQSEEFQICGQRSLESMNLWSTFKVCVRKVTILGKLLAGWVNWIILSVFPGLEALSSSRLKYKNLNVQGM